ncbi:MAG: hypothetical protein AAF657_27755, partial [Acidobacteriota bacterium]
MSHLSLRHAAGDVHVLEEIDRSRFAPESEPLIPEDLWLDEALEETPGGSYKSSRPASANTTSTARDSTWGTVTG